jgi:hypothetical protein
LVGRLGAVVGNTRFSAKADAAKTARTSRASRASTCKATERFGLGAGRLGFSHERSQREQRDMVVLLLREIAGIGRMRWFGLTHSALPVCLQLIHRRRRNRSHSPPDFFWGEVLLRLDRLVALKPVLARRSGRGPGGGPGGGPVAAHHGVQVFAVCEHALELPEGGSLAERLRDGPPCDYRRYPGTML